MHPGYEGIDDVLEEFGMTRASLDPEHPVVLLSSTAAATECSDELFAAAERSLDRARSTRCVSVIAIDYAGSDPIKMGFSREDPRQGPYFDIWLVGREEQDAIRLCRSEVGSAEDRMDNAIDHIIGMCDIIG